MEELLTLFYYEGITWHEEIARMFVVLVCTYLFYSLVKALRL